MTHTLTLEMMGGLFSGDGIHPLITGYAFAADHMIQALNVRIAGGRGFGGFVRAIPRLDNEFSTADLVSQIAERDELFKRTIRKAALGGN